MQQFDLSLWLQDKSRKIVTRDGRPVRIVCWDVKGLFPILALVEGNGEMDTKVGEEYPCCYKIDGTCPATEFYDLFFADEEKCNKILDELKSYLKNTPKEQVEKDWKEIQDWYVQHFTNEKHDGKEKLTEFEKTMIQFSHERNSLIQFEHTTEEINAHLYLYFEKLLDLARKEVLKDLPKWKYINQIQSGNHYAHIANGIISPSGYFISYDDLETLPKEE